MALGTFFERNTNENYTVNVAQNVAQTETLSTAFGGRQSYGAFSEVAIPIFGKDLKFPGMQRFELQVAARYEDRDEAGSTMIPKYGFAWVPFDSLLLRASYSEGFRPPSLTEYQVASAVQINQTVTLDPLRPTAGPTTGITVTRGANQYVAPETSTTSFYGLVFSPKWAEGLSVDVNYYKTEQKNTIQQISLNTIVNNQGFFTDRVTRGPQSAADIAAGRPRSIRNWRSGRSFA